MYTSYIGKKFLKLYNERNKTELTPKEFFDKVIFPLFFDNDRVFLDVHNSSFAKQNKIPKEIIDLNPNKSDFILRKERFYEEVSNGIPHSGILVGYAAKDIKGVSSGQSPSDHSSYNEDEIFCSWIGVGLGIGVDDRFVLLINSDEILWWVFEGWKYYRNYLNQTIIKDKEIEFWNAWWLTNCLSPNFDYSNPTDSLTIQHSTSMGVTRIKKKTWSEVLLPISKKYHREDKFTIYCYKLDKTNTTLGFINVYLKDIYEIYEWRDHIFMNESETILSDRQIEQLSTQFRFKDACAFGTIGLKALEPAKLREFMPKGSVQYAQGKDYKFKDEESYFNYKLFKIWIYAMLNKTELLKLASDIGSSLIALEEKDERGKKVYSTLSQDVRDSKNIRAFIENLSKVLEGTPENADVFKNVVEETLKMPSDNFPLFITLIRFEYNYQRTKK